MGSGEWGLGSGIGIGIGIGIGGWGVESRESGMGDRDWRLGSRELIVDSR